MVAFVLAALTVILTNSSVTDGEESARFQKEYEVGKLQSFYFRVWR